MPPFKHNLRSGELHNLAKAGPFCHAGKIKRSRSVADAEAAFAAGADPCGHCMPGYLVARPKASPPQPLRAGAVTLDGSGSKPRGKIKAYTWTVSPTGAESGGKEVTLEGPTHTFAALGGFKAELEVKGEDDETDKRSVDVSVRARKFGHIDFTHKPGYGVLAQKLSVESVLGRNVCAVDGTTGEQSTQHWLHRENVGGGTWLQTGWWPAEVPADGGPWAGWFYIERQKLFAERAALLNSDLHEGSELWKLNESAGHGGDFRLLADSVRAHENAHSSLAKTALYKLEPFPTQRARAADQAHPGGPDHLRGHDRARRRHRAQRSQLGGERPRRARGRVGQ